MKGYRALCACNQNNNSRSERIEPHYRELEKRRIKEERLYFPKKDPLMALPWNQVKYNKGGFTLTYADIYQSCPTNTIYKFK